MEKLRTQVTLVLLALLVVLTLIQAYSCVVLSSDYEVPAALYGLLGTAVGGLYMPDLVERLRKRNGNGKSDGKSDGMRSENGGNRG